MGASVIARVDASPVLEFGEHILNLVTLLVERLVVVDLPFPVLPWRDTGCNAFFDQGFAEAVGVIPTIGQKVFGPGKSIEK